MIRPCGCATSRPWSGSPSARRSAYTVATDLPISLPDQRDIELGSLLGVPLPPGTGEQRPDLIEQDGSVNA